MNDPHADTVICSKCQRETDALAVFPGGLCLDCYRPIGDREARTMTADNLAAMWGGRNLAR